ncbi:homoserine kinase [Kineococcus radiotolerans]|uniref:Homoserine kinase n=1 Tax=Kineococcus radiotolerans (strain ATCC BAA-149 / DSM 14245 / SRS30216) TaxID=266940 RepID=A6W7F3_KINRD|nr:homoserine kinase [Kineococcus radiotolerans]ABS02742.1 homoserine kinase [Kineococcus radiotolerans SRS30216 = ATCC BAA-149]
MSAPVAVPGPTGTLTPLALGTAVVVRVPATSANLGPGFDAFGLALDLCDEVRAEVGPGGVRVRVEGHGAAALPTDGRHLVARVLLEELAASGFSVPGLDLVCRNVIPHGRGLGSSASAIVAGLAAARALLRAAGVVEETDEQTRQRLLTESTRREGHPDNAAPAVHGGFTIAWSRGEDPTRPDTVSSVRLPVHPHVRAVVCVPAEELATSRARALLPATVPHADAALTAGRAGLLVHALTSAPALLLDATEERLHQAQRAPAMPRTAQLLADLRAAGLAAVVSGAGPSALVLTTAERVPEVERIAGVLGGWEVHDRPVHHRGVQWRTD